MWEIFLSLPVLLFWFYGIQKNKKFETCSTNQHLSRLMSFDMVVPIDYKILSLMFNLHLHFSHLADALILSDL
jgi:hypothetical protein